MQMWKIIFSHLLGILLSQRSCLVRPYLKYMFRKQYCLNFYISSSFQVSAINLVEKAMISPVPGTTLNLLKFPVTRPEPHFLANRRSRLTNANNLFKKMEIDRLKLLSSSKDVMLSVPSHYTIKHTLLSKISDGKGVSEPFFRAEASGDGPEAVK